MLLLYFVIVILATWQCQHILCIHYWVELSLMLSSLLYFVIVIYFAIFSYIFAIFSYIFLYFCYCMWWARTENKQLHLAHLRVYMVIWSFVFLYERFNSDCQISNNPLSTALIRAKCLNKFQRVLSVSLTSFRRNCNLTKDFTFISSQHVSTSWFW